MTPLYLPIVEPLEDDEAAGLELLLEATGRWDIIILASIFWSSWLLFTNIHSQYVS
jgi:hypothetical protein